MTSERHIQDHKPVALPHIILITGIMAAGKSTVAQHLAERLPYSVHLRGDLFRRMIVNGQATMGQALAPEALAQLRLRYDLATTVAEGYLAAGFNVVYQDILMGEDLARVVNTLQRWSLAVVVLCPRPAVAAARDAARSKTGYVNFSADAFDQSLRASTPRIGLWLDTSTMTATETVDAILAQIDQARVSHGALLD